MAQEIATLHQQLWQSSYAQVLDVYQALSAASSESPSRPDLIEQGSQQDETLK
ncbi:hypothetical protein P4S72_16215 [Vibrio sp. PP-XX7]